MSLPFVRVVARFETSDLAHRLRDSNQGGSIFLQELDESENDLAGHDIRVITHIVVDPYTQKRRLGLHLVEVVDPSKPGLTTLDRPLLLRYRARATAFEDFGKTDAGFSRPLDDKFFVNGKLLSQFVDLVDECERARLL